MGDEDGRPGETGDGGAHHLLRLPAQSGIQGGKRFIQQQDVGTGDQDAGQRDPLLLTAGQLGWIIAFQPLQFQIGQLLHGQIAAGSFGQAFVTLGSCHDVLEDRHAGKKRIVLKQITDAALLRLQIDMPPGIEYRTVVDPDDALIRGVDSGDAAEGHGLAAAGISQQSQGFVPGVQLNVQSKGTDGFFDICEN